MDWHKRYQQQAAWTRETRLYLMDKAGIARAHCILEIGCGTGVILQETARQAGNPRMSVHGMDIATQALKQCQQHVPLAHLACGDAHALPYPDQEFDISFCHFLLLWVADPKLALEEMRRVTRRDGYVVALAEPDHDARVDGPGELETLGRLQARALRQQGADTSIGSHLADLFRACGLRIVESGMITSWNPRESSHEDFVSEWQVLREDLQAMLSSRELDHFMQLDADARRRQARRLHVPTYFALAQV